MSDEIKPWLVITNESQFKNKSFETKEEFQEWFSQEEQLFQKRFHFAAQGFSEPNWGRAKKELGNIRSAISDEDMSALMPSLNSAFKWVPFSESTESKLMQHAIDGYSNDVAQELAKHLLHLFQENKFQGSHQLIGAVLALFHYEGIGSSFNKNHADGVYADSQRSLETLKTKLKEVDSFFQEKSCQFATLADKYEQVQSLKGPAKYWSDKEKAHRYITWGFGFVFGLILIIGGLYLVDQAKTVSIAIDAIEDPKPYHWIAHAFPLFVVAVGLFWVLRILARILFQQLHLLSDAAERETMVYTYLSLLVGDGVLAGQTGVSAEDKKIILNQLFRHGQQGLKLEDAAPQIGVMNLLTGDTRAGQG